MIYLMLNGLLVEGETVTEIHMRAEFKRYNAVKRDMVELTDDDTITQIVREVVKQIKEGK